MSNDVPEKKEKEERKGPPRVENGIYQIGSNGSVNFFVSGVFNV